MEGSAARLPPESQTPPGAGCAPLRPAAATAPHLPVRPPARPPRPPCHAPDGHQDLPLQSPWHPRILAPPLCSTLAPEPAAPQPQPARTHPPCPPRSVPSALRALRAPHPPRSAPCALRSKLKPGAQTLQPSREPGHCSEITWLLGASLAGWGCGRPGAGWARASAPSSARSAPAFGNFCGTRTARAQGPRGAGPFPECGTEAGEGSRVGGDTE